MNQIFSSIYFITSFILVLLFLYGFKRITISGARTFAILAFAMTIHTFGYGFELLASDLDTMLTWIRVEYIGCSFYPLLILLFTREYAGEKKIANNAVLTLVGFMNFTTLIMVNTNDLHHLYYNSASVDTSMGFPLLSTEWGIWYLIHNSLLYLVFLYSFVTFILKLYHTRGSNRIKNLLVFIGFLIPLITAIWYHSQQGNFKLDVLPLSFLAMSVLIFYGLLRYKVNFLSDITQEIILDNIEEGVVAVDSEGYLLRANRAFSKYLPQFSNIRIGDSLLKDDQMKDIINDNTVDLLDIKDKKYRIRRINLPSLSGKLLVFSDITESVRINDRLEYLAVTDQLSGLYNRRYFIEYFSEVDRPGFLLILDLDDFKKINDTLGHVKGDILLEKLGKSIKKHFPNNTACRYGGDEFLILHEGSHPDSFIKQVKAFALDCQSRQIGFSAGLAKYIPGDFTSSVAGADKLLYKAKNAGKNRIVLFDDSVYKIEDL